MNIDKMPAGQELDKLIAEKVLGQTDFSHIESYSADIASTWKIINLMRATGWFWSISDNVIGDICCHFGRDEWITSNLYASRALPQSCADTPSLAICRAALKAINET